MRPNIISLLIVAAVTIPTLTFFWSIFVLQAIPTEPFKDGLKLIVREQGWSHFSESSGTSGELPFFHRIRFPYATMVAAKPGAPNGAVVFGIRDNSGFFHAKAEIRRYEVCYVTIENHSARDETLRTFRRKLNEQFPRLTVNTE